MNGRWVVQAADVPLHGTPWLVLKAGSWQAVQRNGPVLELGTAKLARLGPDVLDDPPNIDVMIERFRRADQNRELGEALLDQSLVAGIGNKWKAEALFEARSSPWKRLRAVDDDELRGVLVAASSLMRSDRRRSRVYRKAGRQCVRCGEVIRSWLQGDNARMAYWCPGCQAGTEAPEA